MVTRNQTAKVIVENNYGNMIFGDSSDDNIFWFLPYMCDRSTPKKQFVAHVKDHMKKQAHRPLFFVAHGNKQEAHESFLKTLWEFPIKKRTNIPQANKLPAIHPHKMGKSLSAARKLELWPQFLGDVLADDTEAENADIIETFSPDSVNWLPIFLDINHDDSGPEVIAFIKGLFHWFQKFPDMDTGQRFMVFLAITYNPPPPPAALEPEKQGFLGKLFGRKKEPEPLPKPEPPAVFGEVRAFLQNEKLRQPPGFHPACVHTCPEDKVTAVTLDELKSICVVDFQEWVDEPGLDDFPQLKDFPMTRVGSKEDLVFKKEDGDGQMEEITMSQLIERLAPIIADIKQEI